MRVLSALLRRLCPCAVALALPFPCLGADKPDNVVLRYHFVGAAQLADNTNAAAAKAVFAQPTTVKFESLVLNRLAGQLAASLHLPTNAETEGLLRPLLDDLLRAESVASLGGAPGKPLNYVLAVNLDPQRVEAWQKNLAAALHAPGEALRAGKFSGQEWKTGTGESFWMVPAQNWVLVGRGEDLASVRSGYLEQIQQLGRPTPELDVNFFEAKVDWPRLANWVSLSACPLKLGRTDIAIVAQYGNFYMTSHVTYPTAIEWQPRPMSLPTNLVRGPLFSFACGQNVEPFLKSDETLSRFCSNPLSDQFYFWSMREMPLQDYLAWPAKDPAKTMETLSGQAIGALNPKLGELNGSTLIWAPKASRVLWQGLPLAVPALMLPPASNGQYLVAGLFALTPGQGPAAAALWEQIEGRTDLVYYDWEFTGPRVRELLTVTEIVPLLKMLGIGPHLPSVPPAAPATAGTYPPLPAETASRLNTAKQWLLGLTPLLKNTITEVTKTGPNELTVLRNSPFVFSSLELVLLTHWLSDTPCGPLDWGLLPQAKISPAGMPSKGH
jgi:hypothetical protein